MMMQQDIYPQVSLSYWEASKSTKGRSTSPMFYAIVPPNSSLGK
jgi:hypothetical protein